MPTQLLISKKTLTDKRKLGQLPKKVRQSVEAFLWGSDKRKKRPATKNVLDTTMAWGDILTLMATELVSGIS